LKQYEVSATFFLIGNNCNRRNQEMLRIVAAGHEVASHGYTHKEFPSLSDRELKDELMRTRSLLPPTPRGRPLVRPPGGAMSPRSLFTCAYAGYTTVMWSLDSLDYKHKEPEPLYETCSPERVKPGEIILLHEGQAWTLSALPKIIETLQKAGFEMVTVS